MSDPTRAGAYEIPGWAIAQALRARELARQRAVPLKGEETTDASG